MTLYKYQYVSNWVNVISRLLLSFSMNHSLVDLSLIHVLTNFFFSTLLFFAQKSFVVWAERRNKYSVVSIVSWMPNDLLTNVTYIQFRLVARSSVIMCWALQSQNAVDSQTMENTTNERDFFNFPLYFLFQFQFSIARRSSSFERNWRQKTHSNQSERESEERGKKAKKEII